MPDAIAHYKILESLGAGGLGDVYRARDTQFGRTVAVKVLPPAIVDDPQALQDLLTTAEGLVTLSHPNIASLFEAGAEGGRPFLVFEFVQGEPLSALINGRALNVRRALDFAINLADALAEAHAMEKIHGDIRPDTIFITLKDRAKFMNFGLSRFTAGAAERLTRGATYVAPEEIAGQPADSRSDIYSLGAVLFEMLTGRQRSRGHVLTNINPNVPPDLEQVVGRMLAANVEHRAQSAAAVAAELRAIAAVVDSRTAAAEAFKDPRPRREPQRTRIYVTLVIIVAIGIAAAWAFLS